MGRSWTQGPKSTLAMLVADWKAQLREEGHTASRSLENIPSTITTSFHTRCSQEEPHGVMSSCWSQPAAVPPSEQEGTSSGWLGVGRTLCATPHRAMGVSCRAGGACPTSAVTCSPCLSRCSWVLPWRRDRGEHLLCPPYARTHSQPCPSAALALYCEGRSRSACPWLSPHAPWGRVSVPFPAILLGQLSAGLPQPTPFLSGERASSAWHLLLPLLLLLLLPAPPGVEFPPPPVRPPPMPHPYAFSLAFASP